MSNDLSRPNPERFGLSGFSDILPKRATIIGEDPGSYAAFLDAMMRALTPFTPYECVIAENLIAIEWELLQRRRMRDASLRNSVQRVFRKNVVKREEALHDERLNAAFDEYIEQGGDEDDWEDPFAFDEDAAQALADDLFARLGSPDVDVQAAARAEIFGKGLDFVTMMSQAYVDDVSPANKHDDKIQELERRRREVKRDYDALQKTRPIEGESLGA